MKLINEKRVAVGLKEQCGVCGGQTAGVAIVQRDLAALRLTDMVEHGGFAHLLLTADHDHRVVPGSVTDLLLQMSLDVQSKHLVSRKLKCDFISLKIVIKIECQKQFPIS